MRTRPSALFCNATSFFPLERVNANYSKPADGKLKKEKTNMIFQNLINILIGILYRYRKTRHIKRRNAMTKQHVLITILAGAVLNLGHLATGQNVIPLQGLSETTLVAGKTTGFRLFADPPTYAAANRIETIILRPDGSRLTNTWSRSQVVPIQSSARGSSFLVTVSGQKCPGLEGTHSKQESLTNKTRYWPHTRLIKSRSFQPRTCDSL
jgi:hypothetical protein